LAYVRGYTTWKDFPDTSTPILAAKMQNIEDGIVNATVSGAIVNADINAAAAIAYSKLALTNSIVTGDIVNGTIVDADISASAAIAVSKLTNPADADQVLLGNATYGRKVYRKATLKTVVNTTAATDLLNAEITVGAGVLGATGVLRLSAWGNWIQNTAGNQSSPRIQLVLGGTTLLDTNLLAAVNASNAGTLPWNLAAVIEAQNATNSQFSLLDFDALEVAVASAAATFTTGTGLIRSDAAVGGYHFLKAKGHNTSALDMTTSKTLVLNVILPVASANYGFTLNGALVEII